MVTDVDQDGLISRQDMYAMLDMITEEPLDESVKKKVVDEVRNICSIAYIIYLLTVSHYGGVISCSVICSVTLSNFE